MKNVLKLLIISLATGFLFSFHTKHTSDPEIRLHFLNQEGEKESFPFQAIRTTNWSDSLIEADFLHDGKSIQCSGIIVYVPVREDAVVYSFTDNESFAAEIRKILHASQGKYGDRFIFDNLKILDDKTTLFPVIVTVH